MEPNESVERDMCLLQQRYGVTIPAEQAIPYFLIDYYRDLNRPTLTAGERANRLTFINSITGDIGNILILPKTEAAKLLEAFCARVRTAFIHKLLAFIDPITDDDDPPEEFGDILEFPEGHSLNIKLDWKMAFLLSLVGHLYWDFGIEL